MIISINLCIDFSLSETLYRHLLPSCPSTAMFRARSRLMGCVSTSQCGSCDVTQLEPQRWINWRVNQGEPSNREKD